MKEVPLCSGKGKQQDRERERERDKDGEESPHLLSHQTLDLTLFQRLHDPALRTEIDDLRLRIAEVESLQEFVCDACSSVVSREKSTSVSNRNKNENTSSRCEKRKNHPPNVDATSFFLPPAPPPLPQPLFFKFRWRSLLNVAEKTKVCIVSFTPSPSSAFTPASSAASGLGFLLEVDRLKSKSASVVSFL